MIGTSPEDDELQKFLNDQEAQKAVSETVKLGDVDTSAYKAIFFVGGHGRKLLPFGLRSSLIVWSAMHESK